MPLLLIDNYDSFTFNLFQLVQPLLPEPIAVYRNDRIDFETIRAMQPSHVILSPGPGHPGNDSDFGVCKDVILRQEELGCPVLGVCLGHQGMVHHFGGHVVQAPEIVHGKTSAIAFTPGSRLFDGLSNPFVAMRYHSLVAAEDPFPACLKIIARETNHNLVMAIEHTEKPLYGIQFHPESVGTPEGQKILRNFIESC